MGDAHSQSMLDMYRQALLKRGASALSLDSDEDSQVTAGSKRPPLIQNLPFFPKWANTKSETDGNEPVPSLVLEQRQARRVSEKAAWQISS